MIEFHGVKINKKEVAWNDRATSFLVKKKLFTGLYQSLGKHCTPVSGGNGEHINAVAECADIHACSAHRSLYQSSADVFQLKIHRNGCIYVDHIMRRVRVDHDCFAIQQYGADAYSRNSITSTGAGTAS